MEIVVVLIVVKFEGFLVIARNPPERFWQTFNITDLPKPSRASKNLGKTKVVETDMLRKTGKVNDYFLE